MDRQTQGILNRITSKIPKNLTNISKKVYDLSEEEKALMVLNTRGISTKTKNRVKKLLEAGKFRRSKDELDEKVIAELDDYHRRAIARARASGLLKDPMTDKFYAARTKRSRRIALGLETPVKQKPYTKSEIENAKRHLAPTLNPQKNG